MNNLKKIELLSVIVSLLQPAFSQPIAIGSEKFGKMIYTVPAGWSLTKYQNGARISPDDLPQGEYLAIQVMQSIDFSGTLEQALEKSYDGTCADLQVTKMHDVNGQNYTAREARRSFRGWEYIRCSGGIQVNNGTAYPDEYGLDMFVIKVNNRFERVAVVKSRNTCGGLSRYYPSDRLKYADVIEDFLFSLKFDDWHEPTRVNGTLKGNVFTGVWQGLSMSVGLTKSGAELGAELKVKQLILFSNGQAYFGQNFPLEGLDEINTLIKAENNPRDWGSYSFNSGRGLLKLPYGEIPMRVENDRLVITTKKTDHAFIRLNDVEYVKFSGTYVMQEWNGTIPTVSFTSDGKFTDKGVIRVLYHEYVDCLNPALAPGSGTYELKNHSIIFQYNDGRKIKIAFTEAGFDKSNADPSAKLVFAFNNDVLRRK